MTDSDLCALSQENPSEYLHHGAGFELLHLRFIGAVCGFRFEIHYYAINILEVIICDFFFEEKIYTW